MGGGSIADLIDGVEGIVHCGIEADRGLGAGDIVIDSAGNADHGKLELRPEGVSPAERAISPDHDEAVNALLARETNRFLSAAFSSRNFLRSAACSF